MITCIQVKCDLMKSVSQIMVGMRSYISAMTITRSMIYWDLINLQKANRASYVQPVTLRLQVGLFLKSAHLRIVPQILRLDGYCSMCYTVSYTLFCLFCLWVSGILTAPVTLARAFVIFITHFFTCYISVSLQVRHSSSSCHRSKYLAFCLVTLVPLI